LLLAARSACLRSAAAAANLFRQLLRPQRRHSMGLQVEVEEQSVVGTDGVARRLQDSHSDPLERVPYWAALVTYFG
jgi:hypothetical protein